MREQFAYSTLACANAHVLFHIPETSSICKITFADHDHRRDPFDSAASRGRCIQPFDCLQRRRPIGLMGIGIIDGLTHARQIDKKRHTHPPGNSYFRQDIVC